MNRKAVVLLVFLAVLCILPSDLSPSYGPSAIVAEQNMVSDEPVIGSVVYTQFGYTTYLGDGRYSYSSVMGMENTWDGSRFVKWFYNPDDKSLKIGSVRFTHLPGGSLRLEGDAGTIIDSLKWYSQYYLNSKWNNVTLDNYAFRGIAFYNDRIEVRQQFWGPTGELNLTYIYNRFGTFKITVDVTNKAAIAVPVRIAWVALGIKNIVGNYELIRENETVIGINIEGLNLQWSDVYQSDPNIAINTFLDRPNRMAAVIFGNQSSVLPAGRTYTLDPSVNPVIIDANDDWWRLNFLTGEKTHTTNDDEIYLLHAFSPDFDYVYQGQMRFILAIPQAATIDSANITAYELTDNGGTAATIWRINEENVGPLESDTTFPSRANTTTATWTWDSIASEWSFGAVTTLVQEQINLAGWQSGYGMGFRFGYSASKTIHCRFADITYGVAYAAYMNITYTEAGGNNVPSNDGCTLTNPDDTDNLYAVYKDYLFTSNVSDADGFADIDYIEMSSYSASAYWTVRYDEDTDTFSEQVGASYIVLGGSSAASESGNTIDITWVIEIEWAHGDLANYDLRLYTVDDEPESDTDDYDLNYDYETRVDITTGPTFNDGSGTADRGDYNSIDSITATGTIDYYGSSISPASAEVDIWASCSDIAGSPWSDTTLTDGAFSLTVDSDDVVGLDTYSFKVVQEGAGSGGSDLCQASESDVYIADRMVITILADDNTVVNGTQVNFTVTVIYDYDDTSFSWWNISVTNDGVFFGVFTYASTDFNDTDADTTNIYSVNAFNNETTHVITKFSAIPESVTWSSEGGLEGVNIFYDLFFSANMWSYLGPMGLVVIGYFLVTKNKILGILWFVLECLFMAQYFTLVPANPDYWWHIFILLLGGLFTCVYPLWDR